MKAGWVEIPHEDLLNRMVPIGRSGATVFPTTGLSESEKRKEKLRNNAAKARAAKAAKKLAREEKEKRVSRSKLEVA